MLLFVFAALFLVAAARAFWLQAVDGPRLAAMANRQHTQTVAIPAGRGTVYDRNGVELAIGEPATTVYADPTQVKDAQGTALAAQAILGVDPNAIYRALMNKGTHFAYIARQADPIKAALLRKKALPGIFFYNEEHRAYPQGAVAANVLGFAGIDNHGLAGLENSLDASLVGHPGSQTVIKAPDGTTLDVESATPEHQGQSVVLAIDHTIQAETEAVLRDTMTQWHAKAASAVVLDPTTGEVLAMANAPGFNANNYAKADPESERNRTVTDTYEPGSTFKLVTVTGALGEKLVTPATRFDLPYSIDVADRTVHDAETRGTETFTVRQILSRSSNVGAITLAEKLGKDRLAAWIDRFGFGKTTGIDFPGESSGIVLAKEHWSGSTIGNVPIGQGIAVTPIQMASAYATIANGGERIVPRVVQSIGGKVTPTVKTRVIPAPLARELTGMLTNVVVAGTGAEAAIPGFNVAGKTGTAEKPDPRGGYAKGKYVASFVGFVPASKPRFVVLVMVDEPQGAILGGIIAAPAFQRIARFALQYYEVPPDAPRTLAGAVGAAAPAAVTAATTVAAATTTAAAASAGAALATATTGVMSGTAGLTPLR